MSYNFYVLEGKKFIDYKPKKEHYERAYVRNLENIGKKFGNFTFKEIKKIQPDVIDKILFLLIKMTEKMEGNFDGTNETVVRILFERISFIESLVGLYTPREFMRLFPIKKDYGGEKICCKDYFYCMDYINKMGIDAPIGEKASEFLMEYWNWDINFYMVTWMDIVSAMNIMNGGKDPLIEFMENQGVHFKTMHQEGNFMVDDETGEQFEMKKPKNPMRKLFSVVE